MLLAILVPLVRHDRATLGQVTVNLAPVRGELSLRPPNALSVLVRAVVRWGPLVAFSFIGLGVVAVVETVVVAARRDRRSLAGICGRTSTRTRPALDAAVVGYVDGTDGPRAVVEAP